MLHVLTVHHESDRFVELQTDALRRHVSAPYKTWAVLTGPRSRAATRFDELIAPKSKDHASRLDDLARFACAEADDDDVLLFLDGDAWPIADPARVIEAVLARNALMAVRRDEGSNGGWPHPCFCAVKAATWRKYEMTWRVGTLTPGYAPNALNRRDVGVELLKVLDRNSLPWKPLLRSSGQDLHPLFFAVYGALVYHHGAGFRAPQWMAEGNDPVKRQRNKTASEMILRAAHHDPEFWLAL